MASFRCYDNSDVIATLIMTNFHLYLMQLWWQFSQCLLGIDPEKLYRGTFICQNGLSCYIIWASFLFDCFVKICATCKNFLGKWFTASPGRKLPVRLCERRMILVQLAASKQRQRGRELRAMTATKSQGSETCVTGGRKLY